MRALWQCTMDRLEALPWPEEAPSLDAVTQRLPEGFYTTFRTFDRKARVLGLRRHLKRLYPPGFRAAVPELTLRQALRTVLARFPEAEARVRVLMTEQACYLLLEPLPTWSPEIYTQGVAVITAPLRRPRPWEKRSAFIAETTQLRERLAREGKFEIILAACGHLREGMTSNFFWVREGILFTARGGILPGVTRWAVLQVARRLGIPRKYRMLPWTEIPTIHEAFLTSSSRGVVPIVNIDGLPVGDGRPGPITRRLMEAYAAYVDRAAEPI